MSTSVKNGADPTPEEEVSRTSLEILRLEEEIEQHQRRITSLRYELKFAELNHRASTLILRAAQRERARRP